MKQAFTMAGAGQRTPLFGWMAHGHVAFTMTARLSRFYNGFADLRSAFTMAEILLSLTIIGVVAAITLPSLTGNINERTWNTQRKALYSRMSQAVALMPALNNYGTLDSTDSYNVAETFITNGLSKVLKINNICSHNKLEDCGLAPTVNILSDGTKLDLPTTLNDLNPEMVSTTVTYTTGSTITYEAVNTHAAGLETANGESLVVYYNPRCTSNMNERSAYMVQSKICAHFIYDLNGKKGPNTMNKDIGIMTVIYPNDSVVVAPIVQNRDASDSVVYDDMQKQCVAQDPEYRAPNQYELMSMFASKKLIGNLSQAYRPTEININTTTSTVLAWRLMMNKGNMDATLKTDPWPVRCVKR